MRLSRGWPTTQGASIQSLRNSRNFLGGGRSFTVLHVCVSLRSVQCSRHIPYTRATAAILFRIKCRQIARAELVLGVPCAPIGTSLIYEHLRMAV